MVPHNKRSEKVVSKQQLKQQKQQMVEEKKKGGKKQHHGSNSHHNAAMPSAHHQSNVAIKNAITWEDWNNYLTAKQNFQNVLLKYDWSDVPQLHKLIERNCGIQPPLLHEAKPKTTED